MQSFWERTVALRTCVDLALQVLDFGELGQHLCDVARLAGDGCATAAVLVAIGELERQISERFSGARLVTALATRDLRHGNTYTI